jgi:hypothetical protein
MIEGNRVSMVLEDRFRRPVSGMVYVLVTSELLFIERNEARWTQGFIELERASLGLATMRFGIK